MNCSVEGCQSEAEYKVILYDVYIDMEEVFFEQDFTCPFMCARHMAENERLAKGERKPRGYTQCPYTNKEFAQGFTIYQPLSQNLAGGSV